jgi:hypothetical protein
MHAEMTLGYMHLLHVVWGVATSCNNRSMPLLCWIRLGQNEVSPERAAVRFRN